MARTRLPLANGFQPRLRDWIQREVQNAPERPSTIEHLFGSTFDTVERIRHQLGRVPTGVRVTGMNKSAVVWRDDTAPKHDRYYLYLKSSVGSVTVQLEVF